MLKFRFDKILHYLSIFLLIIEGLMPVMLEEILNTRIMVKKAAKESKNDRVC